MNSLLRFNLMIKKRLRLPILYHTQAPSHPFKRIECIAQIRLGVGSHKTGSNARGAEWNSRGAYCHDENSLMEQFSCHLYCQFGLTNEDRHNMGLGGQGVKTELLQTMPEKSSILLKAFNKLRLLFQDVQ